MSELELLQQAVAACMLLVASYFDLRERRVSDMVWITFGGAGAILHLFGPVSLATVLYISIGAMTGAVLLFSKVLGQADCLALVALAVVLPAHGTLPVAAAVALAMPLLATSYSLCRNIAYNVSDLLRGRLFCGICDGAHRKAVAFFVLHKKRRHERFAVRAQSGNRLVFHFRPSSDIGTAGDFEGYVSSALPMMPFMAASLAMILAL